MTEQPKDEWYITRHRENFNTGPYDTPEAAIADAPNELCLDPGDKFYVGKRGPAPDVSIDAGSLINDLVQQVDDELGDDFDVFRDVTPEQEAELEAALNRELCAWMDRHGHRPNCWTITDEQTHVYQPVEADHAS